MRWHLPLSIQILLFTILFTLGLPAQDFKPATSTNAKQFLGKWQSSFQGKVFLTISLAGNANKLSGSVSHVDVELNDAGELTKAEANEGSDPDPITNAQVNGSRLRITAKSSDGSGDTMDSEIVLTSAEEAEFRIIVPPDVPRPKAWKLKRVPGSQLKFLRFR